MTGSLTPEKVRSLTAEDLGLAPASPVLGTMPERIRAAKRVNVAASENIPDWFVGYGKDVSCQIEGTANHWNWLALLILGLADPTERPYSEDKPLPIDPALVCRAVAAHAPLVLAAKEAALIIAEMAKAAGADPAKGTCLPRLLAAVKLAEGR